MKHRVRLFLVLIAAAAVLAASLPSNAYIYAGKRKKIYCGIVYVRNANQPVNAGLDAMDRIIGNKQVGDLFYLLDRRIDIKPAGWSLENPLAPGSPSTGLSKKDPDYWMVDLSAHRDLSVMNVLYLPAAGTVMLSVQDREKLRQFVDGGGVLWIDNTSSSLDFKDTFFISDFLFRPVTGSGTNAPISRHHPLLTVPFWLSDSEIASLGMLAAGAMPCYIQPGYDPNKVGWSSVSSQPTSFDVLYPVVANNLTKPTVAANAYGSGRIAATADFVGCGCYLNYPMSVPDVKFAYNLMAWASSWTHLRKDPRHSGNSIDTVGGTKLLDSWTLEEPPAGGVETAPVIYKNVVFYTSGNKLYACDLSPQEDLDQDGNPDDGMSDTSGQLSGLGQLGQDVIWVWSESGGGKLSSPTIVTAQDPKNPANSIEAVLVMSSTGMVYMIPAFPNTNGILNAGPPSESDLMRPWDTKASTSKPFPPLYVNGWIYAVGGDGRLHAYNPSLAQWGAQPGNTLTGPTEWMVPGAPSGNTTGTAEPKSAPTFGFVKNDTTGAICGTVYWSSSTWPKAGLQPNALPRNDEIYGVPVYVSNDRLKITENDQATTNVIEVRGSYKGRISTLPTPVVRLFTADGVEIGVNNVQPNMVLVGGVPTAIGPTNTVTTMVVTASTVVPSDATAIGTYALEYGTNFWNQSAPFERGLEPNSSSTAVPVPKHTVVGTLTMGSDNMIFLNARRENDSGPEIGDSTYGLRNDGTSQTTEWNYQFHDGLTGGSALALLAPVAGNSGIAPIPGIVWDKATQLSMELPKAYSSPAVSGSKVFVTVSAANPATTSPAPPTAALLCFKSNQDFTIRVTENAGYGPDGMPMRKSKRLINPRGDHMKVQIWQPNLTDFSGTQPPPPPTGAVEVTSNLNMVDYDHGTITFNSFDQVKLKGASGLLQTNTFTPSLPVWVYLDNVLVPVDFNTWGPSKALASAMGTPLRTNVGDSVDLSSWNNLLWYFIVPEHELPDGSKKPCSGIHSSPVVIGNTVYFTCDDGVMYAVPSETGESQGLQIDSKSMSWEMKVGPSWSAGAGAPTSVAGSNGVMMVPTSNGLHALMNATTLVTDSNRVLEIDGSGEASWSIDSVSMPANAPMVATVSPARMSGPVNKPARAKYSGPGEILLANTGANMVCKIDKSGLVGFDRLPDGKCVRWMWEKFSDPRRLLRPGQPLMLRAPTDAFFWREMESQNKLVFHCLVADSGNHRIVDLVYRVNVTNNGAVSLDASDESKDQATGFYLPELNWVSATSSMNERYVFQNLQVVTTPQTNTQSATQTIWAAVSNYQTGTGTGAGTQKEGLGGAVVALAYRSWSSSGWDYADPKSGQIIGACDKAAWPEGVKPLASPRCFEVKDRPDGSRYLIICDNYGVYEVGPVGGGVPDVVRFFEDGIYDPTAGAARDQMQYRNIDRAAVRDYDGAGSWTNSLGGFPLMAVSVQELPNGNWLVVNGYSGSLSVNYPDYPVVTAPLDKQFAGEVFEIKWKSSTGPVDSISWCSPEIRVKCDDTDQHTALPWTWWQNSKTSYTFQQPTSAYRQY